MQVQEEQAQAYLDSKRPGTPIGPFWVGVALHLLAMLIPLGAVAGVFYVAIHISWLVGTIFAILLLLVSESCGGLFIAWKPSEIKAYYRIWNGISHLRSSD